MLFLGQSDFGRLVISENIWVFDQIWGIDKRLGVVRVPFPQSPFAVVWRNHILFSLELFLFIFTTRLSWPKFHHRWLLVSMCILPVTVQKRLLFFRSYCLDRCRRILLVLENTTIFARIIFKFILFSLIVGSCNSRWLHILDLLILFRIGCWSDRFHCFSLWNEKQIWRTSHALHLNVRTYHAWSSICRRSDRIVVVIAIGGQGGRAVIWLDRI